MSNRIINIVNSNGTFSYNSNGCFSTNNENTSIISKNNILLDSLNTLITTDNLNLYTNEMIKIISKNNTNNAILLETSSQNSGITIKTHKDGEVNVLSGNINFNASNGNISLGQKCDDSNLVNLTKSVSIDALRKVSINTEDFYTIASDSINFISQTGDITFGSQIGESFIKFENNNLLINQQSSNYNRILDIHVNKPDNLGNNNGILVYSSIPDINSNIKLENDIKNNLQIGLTSSEISKTLKTQSTHKEIYNNYSNNKNNISINDYNISKKLIGYQKDNTIFLHTFIDLNDISKNVIWENDKIITKLETPIKYVLNSTKCKSDFEIKIRIINNNISFGAIKYNLKSVKINEINGIIIKTEHNNKFSWGYTDKYNNCLFNFNKNQNQNKNINITKDPILLDNIEIIFPTMTGYDVGDYWIVSLLQTIQTTTKKTVELQKCYVLKNKVGFISTYNNELQLSTSNKNRMLLSSDGGICFNNDSEDNCTIFPNAFTISNSLNKESYVSIEGTHISQSSNQILQLENGGFVILWEEQYENCSHIFFKHYNADGSLFPHSKKQMVNTTKSGYHQQPHISNFNNNNNYNNNNNKSNQETFIVVWSKKESLSNEVNNIYNLYAQIFINYNKKKGFDIPLGSIYNNHNSVSIKSTRLSSGNFGIIWCGENSNISHYSIYGLILDVGGNIIKNTFKISEQNSIHSYLKPCIYSFNGLFNNNDNYIVLYHTRNNEYNEEYNNNIFDTKYKILNENNIKAEEQHLLSSYGENDIQILNNNIYITLFEPLFLNTIPDEKDTYKIIGINQYDIVDINIKIINFKDNIISISSKDLVLLKQNDVIIIRHKSNLKSYISNAKIDLINTEKNIIVLSKTDLNLSIYKCDVIDKKIVLENKKHNINNNNTTILNINKHKQKKLHCCLTITLNGDICILWGNSNIGVFIALVSDNLETKIYDTKLLNNYRDIDNIKIKQILSNNRSDAGLILSFIININNNTNILYKCIDLYNDLFKVKINNNHSNYSNGITGLSINSSGHTRIGIGSEESTYKYNRSDLYLNGSFSSKIITINGFKKYIVSHNDNTILVDASVNDVLIILDNNHTYYGRTYIIKHIKGLNNVIIKSSSLIDGKYKQILKTRWELLKVQSNGIEWFIVN